MGKAPHDGTGPDFTARPCPLGRPRNKCPLNRPHAATLVRSDESAVGHLLPHSPRLGGVLQVLRQRMMIAGWLGNQIDHEHSISGTGALQLTDFGVRIAAIFGRKKNGGRSHGLRIAPSSSQPTNPPVFVYAYFTALTSAPQSALPHILPHSTGRAKGSVRRLPKRRSSPRTGV